MVIIITGTTNEDGSVSLPEGADLPKEYFECLCMGDAYYFFFTKAERDAFYDERGMSHD